ncbi:MAG: nucleotidyltransferase family protein [Bacteroidales bacterium]|jgi:D-glycero-alpha-D-manno-heptose 1-phosphate guanylyltransferase|nr:nucleotidyltransferase family protein [Bacteroidales bacterium]
MIKEAIILAGGMGTRLKSITGSLPKPMAPVNGRPFLEYILDYLELYSVKRVILSVGYNHEAIESHFKKRYKYINIDYAIEETPLGTGGGILQAMKMIEGRRAIVMNGDTMYRVNLGKLYDFTQVHKANIALALREVNDVSRYGAVEINERAIITSFREKGEISGKGMISGGVYAINKDFFLDFGLPEAFSMEKDFFEKIYKEQSIYGIRCNQFFLDIGIPEDYQKAQDEFKLFEY